MTTVVEVLTKAKALIADQEHWCTKVFAMDSLGEHCLPNETRTARWCALGALECATRSRRIELYDKAYECLREFAERSNVIYTNDKVGHAAVMTMYDKAIAYAKENNL